MRAAFLPLLFLAGCYPEEAIIAPPQPPARPAPSEPVVIAPAPVPVGPRPVVLKQPSPPVLDGFTEFIDVTVFNFSAPIPGITSGYTIRARRLPYQPAGMGWSSTWYARDGNIIVQFLRNEGAGSNHKLIHFNISFANGGGYKMNWNVDDGLPSSSAVITGNPDPNDLHPDPTRRNRITFTATLTPVP